MAARRETYPGQRVYRASNSCVFGHVRTSSDRGKLLWKGDIRVCPETDAEMGFRWSGVQIPLPDQIEPLLPQRLSCENFESR